MKNYILKVEPITAVHIATGNEIDPLEYTIKNGQYIRFSNEKVIRSLSKEKSEEMLKLSDKEEYKELAVFFHNNLNDEGILYKSPASGSVSVKFENNRDSYNNQLLVGEIYRNKSNYKPVIPGSSLKGAIRTAIVSKYGLELPESNYEDKYKKPPFEQVALKFSDAKNDPFRAVQISDCEIEGENIQYVSDFINFKENRKQGKDFSQMQMTKEQIIGQMLNGDARGNCTINISDDLQNITKSLYRWDPIKKSITVEEIIAACNDFYRNNFLNEFRKFYQKSKYPELVENGNKILEYIETIDPDKNECLIRVGRFSQVENITVETHRKPWNKKGHGETRTITEDKFPAGLVKLTFIPYNDYWAEEKQKLQKLEAGEKAEEERINAEETRIKAEQERLANMSKDDKMLEKISNLEKDTQQISEIYQECIQGDFNKEVYIQLKEKIITLDEWKPSGSKHRKQKLEKRNQKIEAKINA